MFCKSFGFIVACFTFRRCKICSRFFFRVAWFNEFQINYYREGFEKILFLRFFITGGNLLVRKAFFVNFGLQFAARRIGFTLRLHEKHSWIGFIFNLSPLIYF